METATAVFDLHALKEFAADKRVRKMLFKTDQLWSEIACYEPGQSTPMHSHPREEEATFPASVPHDVRNLEAGRCVIMFLKVNPKVLR
jgi:hypothetical protein